MKYFLVTIVLLPLFWVACFADETAAAASQAVLTVEVTNGTANGGTVADDVVIVRVYQHEQLLSTLEGKVDADGKAVFENVPTGEHIVAVAGVKHQNMMFSSRPVALKQAQNAVSARVQVFDVSDDKSNLSVETHHFIIKAWSDALEITEYMHLKNSSDMAVKSKQRDSRDKPIVLEIMLPKGFKNLRSSGYFEENALVVTEKGFYDTMAVPPGDHQVSFSYTLDINSDTMDIIKRLSLPTSNFMLFTELGQAKVQGLGQAENQLTRANRVPMEYYKLNNLAPAEEIAFQITGFNVNTSDLSSWVILSVVVGAMMVLAIFRLRLRKG